MPQHKAPVKKRVLKKVAPVKKPMHKMPDGKMMKGKKHG